MFVWRQISELMEDFILKRPLQHPKSGLNGVKPPVDFGERILDCSLGHAGKEGPHLAMTGASRGFSQGAVPGWGFSRYRTGS